MLKSVTWQKKKICVRLANTMLGFFTTGSKLHVCSNLIIIEMFRPASTWLGVS